MYDGDLFADTLQMAGTTVKNVTMGIVDTAQNVVTGSGPVGNGLWGISFSVGQANTVVHDDPPYKSVLQKMKDAGVIKSIAYSLWLDSIGTLIFSLSLSKVSLVAAANSLTDRRKKWVHPLRGSRLGQIQPSADWCPNHQKPQKSAFQPHDCRIHLTLSQRSKGNRHLNQ